MTYQVIARKWRPQSFEEVTGQEPITRTLRNAIESARLHHAYLFSGARGVGKTTTARLLAKALNCHKSNKPTATPCAFTDPTACPSCMEIAEGRSIDVLEIDAASNTGVDNVREAIIGSVAVAPARDRYKVFIIDEVHMLSGAAFNALLKTLEEPPPRVVFIMATTERHKLPDTILSRCQQFEFRTIATAKIADRLRLIADAEKVRITDDALKEVARSGEGSMRDAQSAFDQVISFSGTEIKAEDVEMALGMAGSETLSRTMRAIIDRKPAEALAIVNDLVMRGSDLRNFCRDLAAHIRDLLVVKVAGDSSELLDSSATEPAELSAQASAFSESDLVRFFHSLSETESSLRNATQPRYQLEIGLVKLMEMQTLTPLTEMLERLSALEEALRTGSPPAPLDRGTNPSAAPGRPRQGGESRSQSAPFTRPDFRSSGKRKTDDAAPRTRSFSEPSAPAAGAEESEGLRAGNGAGLTLVRPPTVTANDGPQNADVTPGVVASAADGSSLQTIKRILEERRKMLLVTALEGAHKAVIDGDEIYVEFSAGVKHLRDSLAKPENIKVLREACRDALGRDVGVRIVVKEPDEADGGQMSKIEAARQERQRLREMAEQHPAVQQLLKTFHGEIVDVRKVEE
jgi:DNA polymerase-3 subunit gamma/tau